jgi:hypothetical protein
MATLSKQLKKDSIKICLSRVDWKKDKKISLMPLSQAGLSPTPIHAF